MKCILIFFATFSFFTCRAQHSDPYKVFGHTSSINYREKPIMDFLIVKNSDTSSTIRVIAFDMGNSLAYLLDSHDSILGSVVIEKDKLLRWLSVDPLANKREWVSPYNFVQNNPINRNDPTGAIDDWVQDNVSGSISWDKTTTSQSTTKEGKTYLGKDLTFTFNSYIDKDLWDGPLGDFPAGDKLTSTITVKSNTDDDNDLVSVDIKSSTFVHKTGGIFQGDGYYPGQKNINLDIKGATQGIATFEKHAKVNRAEEMGLTAMGYDKVNVAQKLQLGINGPNLSVKASTDIFPSATLRVNGIQLFKYNQPSFEATHGKSSSYTDNGTGGVNTRDISNRPDPAFYTRYNR